MCGSIEELIGAAGFADAAIGVTDGDGVVFRYGNSASSYRIASVTKIFTALSVLLAVDDGTVSLDDETGPNGARLFHLLSHASGISFDSPNVVLAPPGSRRIYSNAGIEMAEDYVEKKLPVSFADFMRGKLLDPLGMTNSRVEGSYAKDGVSVLSDLLKLGKELLEQKVLPRSVHTGISQVCCPNLGGVLPGFGRQENCDFSLGAEIKDAKSPHWTGNDNSPETFGHFGQSGCFIWVDKSAGLACVYLGRDSFGDTHKKIWPQLSDLILSIYAHRC